MVLEFSINKMSEEERLALLFGVLLGDGCLSHLYFKNRERRAFYVTGNYYDDGEFFDRVVIPLARSFTHRELSVKLRPKYGAREITFSNKDLFLRYESLGFNSGKKGNIAIPPIFTGHLMRYVVAGLLATDGCLTIVNNNGTQYPRLFFTACLPTAFGQICDYLNKINIKSSFYTAKRVDIGQSFRQIKTKYVVSSNGKENIRKFSELIGFLNPKHEARYQNYLRNGSGESRTPDFGLMRAAL